MAESNGDTETIEITVPEIEFNPEDPLHDAAIKLRVKRTQDFCEAMGLLLEARNLCDVADQLERPPPMAMVSDIGRRVRDALAALDRQEHAERDVYIALAESQRGAAEKRSTRAE